MNLERCAPIRAVVSRIPLSCQAQSRDLLLTCPFAPRLLLQASGIANVFNSELNQQHFQNTCSSPQYTLQQNGAQHTSAATTKVFAQVFQRYAPVASTTFQRQSARTFMLQCRLRSCNPTGIEAWQPMAVFGRHYSTTTESASSESRSELFVDASMVKTDDGLLQMKLRLARDEGVENDDTEHTGQTQELRTVHEIAIPEVRSGSRAMRIELGSIRGENTRRAIEFKMRQDMSVVTWIQVLQRLEHNTRPMPTSGFSLVVEGPDFDLVELYHTLLSDRTYHAVLDYPVSAEGRSKMLVLGTEKNIEDVTKFIRGDSEWSHVSIGIKQRFSSWGMVNELKETLCARWSRDSRLSKRLNEVRRPTAWTKRSLAEFFRSITISRPPRVLRQGISHKDLVERTLIELLYNSPDLRSVLSWNALHIAMTFMVKHRDFFAAKALLGHMERHGFAPNVETFNVLLRSCALEQNMSSFNHHMNLMHQEGILPNDGSWVALMLGSPNLVAQKAIARKMFLMGFAIKPNFCRANAPQIIPYSFAPFLDADGTIGEYIATLDDLYGPVWIHPASVVNLVAALAARRRFISAIEMINDFIRNRDYTVTNGIVHILLRHCVRQTNADLAIWFMAYASRTWSTRSIDHITLSFLFAVAWKSRMLNVVRVAWKYAHAAGEASYEMRRKIHLSLLARMKPSPSTVSGCWQSGVGSVACGVDPLTTSLTPEDILEKEKWLFGRKPVFPLSLQLVKAMILDKAWTKAEVRKSRGVTWKLRETIQIPFAPAERVLRKIMSDKEPVRAPHGRTRVSMRIPTSGRFMVPKTEEAERVDESEGS